MAEKTEKVAYKPSNLKGKAGKERPLCRPITMASSLFNNTSDQQQIQMVHFTQYYSKVPTLFGNHSTAYRLLFGRLITQRDKK